MTARAPPRERSQRIREPWLATRSRACWRASALLRGGGGGGGGGKREERGRRRRARRATQVFAVSYRHRCCLGAPGGAGRPRPPARWAPAGGAGEQERGREEEEEGTPSEHTLEHRGLG